MIECSIGLKNDSGRYIIEALLNSEVTLALRTLFGEAFSNEFVRTSTVFVLAAFVHGRQVRIEIRTQLTDLTNALRADLAAQKETTGLLSSRITKIEEHLNMEGKDVRYQ